MLTTLAVICILFMLAAMALHLFGLPANWLVFGIAVLWTVFAPQKAMTFGVLAVMGVMALAGEAVEAIMLHVWGKKYGGSGKATIGGILGAFIGAVLGAPFFLGVGALLGALAGAFLGSLAVELFRGRPNNEALRAAWGTMLGRFGGTMLKAAIGFAMIAIAAPRIWAG